MDTNSQNSTRGLSAEMSQDTIEGAASQMSGSSKLHALPADSSPLDACDAIPEALRLKVYNKQTWHMVSRPIYASNEKKHIIFPPSVDPNILFEVTQKHKCREVAYPAPQNDKELKQFFGFRKLPIELRLKIWELALPEGRVVLFRYAPHRFLGGPTYYLVHKNRVVGKEHLLACTESNKVFNNRYHRIQALDESNTPHYGPDNSTWYIDAKRDTLVLDIADIISLNKINWTLDLSQLENLALASENLLTDGLSAAALAKAVCPRLKNLTIMQDQMIQNWPAECLYLTADPDDNLRLVEVNSQLRYIDLDGGGRKGRELRDYLQEIDVEIDAAIMDTEPVQARFDAAVLEDPEGLANVKLKMSLLACFQSDPGSSRKLQWLKPVTRLRGRRVAYYTWVPTKYPRDHRIKVFDLVQFISCSVDEVLASKYDGIRELFGAED